MFDVMFGSESGCDSFSRIEKLVHFIGIETLGIFLIPGGKQSVTNLMKLSINGEDFDYRRCKWLQYPNNSNE